jgi:hypothetical protein
MHACTHVRRGALAPQDCFIAFGDLGAKLALLLLLLGITQFPYTFIGNCQLLSLFFGSLDALGGTVQSV